MSRKALLVTVLLITGLGVLAYGIYQTWLNAPPPMPTTAEEALAVIGTPQYEALPDYRKREYVAQAQRLVQAMPAGDRVLLFEQARTDEATRKAVGEMQREVMVQRALEYAAAPPAQRNQVLDASIDEMEKMRAQFGNRPGGSPGGSGADNSPEAAAKREEFKAKGREMMKERFQHGNPQVGALVGEYFRAIQRRREERGMKQFP